MWWGHAGYGWEWTMLGGLMMLLFWGGLLAIIIVAVRALVGSTIHLPRKKAGTSGAETNNAQTILKTRYARGEITEAEYQEMRDVLNQT